MFNVFVYTRMLSHLCVGKMDSFKLTLLVLTLLAISVTVSIAPFQIVREPSTLHGDMATANKQTPSLKGPLTDTAPRR